MDGIYLLIFFFFPCVQVIFRLPSAPDSDGIRDSSIYQVYTRASVYLHGVNSRRKHSGRWAGWKLENGESICRIKSIDPKGNGAECIHGAS